MYMDRRNNPSRLHDLPCGNSGRNRNGRIGASRREDDNMLRKQRSHLLQGESPKRRRESKHRRTMERLLSNLRGNHPRQHPPQRKLHQWRMRRKLLFCTNLCLPWSNQINQWPTMFRQLWNAPRSHQLSRRLRQRLSDRLSTSWRRSASS